MSKLQSPEAVKQAVQSLGIEQAKVMGHGALMPLGIAIEHKGPVEVQVTTEAFSGLVASGAKPHKETGRIYRHGLAISDNSTIAPGMTYETLPEVYELAQSLGDSSVTTAIREHLYDPNFTLPEETVAEELDHLRSVLPSAVAEQPALHVAAELLYGVKTLYGSLHSPDGVRLYRGSYEQHYVPATYHNYEHSAGDVVRGAIDHIERTGGVKTWSAEDYLAAIIGGAGHDIIVGNGRRADNPERYDEKLSAELIRDKILRQGGARSLAEKAFQGAMATEYNEATRGQNVRPEAGAHNVQVAVSGADLSRASTPGFMQNCFLWPMEEQSRRNSGRPLAGALRELRAYVGSRITPEALAETIDEDEAARQAIARAALGNAGFVLAIRYPEGWAGDNPELRAQHAAEAKAIGERIMAGASVAEEYAQVAGRVPKVWER